MLETNLLDCYLLVGQHFRYVESETKKTFQHEPIDHLNQFAFLFKPINVSHALLCLIYT